MEQVGTGTWRKAIRSSQPTEYRRNAAARNDACETADARSATS